MTSLKPLAIAALLTFATGISAQEPASAILPAGEIREAIQELRESSKANRELAGEARAWRGLLDRIEARISAWDGSALRALLTAIWSPIATAAVAVYRLAWGLIAAGIVALIALALDRLANVAKVIADIFRPRQQPT